MKTLFSVNQAFHMNLSELVSDGRSFFPKTWVLPHQYRSLWNDVTRSNPSSSKNTATSAGTTTGSTAHHSSNCDSATQPIRKKARTLIVKPYGNCEGEVPRALLLQNGLTMFRGTDMIVAIGDLSHSLLCRHQPNGCGSGAEVLSSWLCARGCLSKA